MMPSISAGGECCRALLKFFWFAIFDTSFVLEFMIAENFRRTNSGSSTFYIWYLLTSSNKNQLDLHSRLVSRDVVKSQPFNTAPPFNTSDFRKSLDLEWKSSSCLA